MLKQKPQLREPVGSTHRLRAGRVLLAALRFLSAATTSVAAAKTFQARLTGVFLYTRGRVRSLRVSGVVAVVGLLAAGVLSYGVLFQPATATAGPANTVNFQARLETASGAIAADGFYNVRFKLYSASSGGTALWTETYLVSSSTGVRTANGYLTANLGGITAFPGSIDWGQQLYLTMEIGGTGSSPTWDGEMSPRLSLTSVPSAFALNSYNSTLGFTGSLKVAQPTGGNQTFTVPDQGAAGNYTLMTTNAASTGFIQNQNASAQSTANFWISGSGRAGSFLSPVFDTPAAGTLSIGTTNATAITIGKTGVMTTIAGNATVSGTLNVTGTASFASSLQVTGDFQTGNQWTRSVNRTLPTVVGGAVDIGIFSVSAGARTLDISIVVSDSGFSVAKRYVVPISYLPGPATWYAVQPISDTGVYSGNDFALDINISGSDASLRIRRAAGATSGTARVTMVQQGSSIEAFTPSAATSSVTAPTSTFAQTSLTQTNGRVGVGTVAPAQSLDVQGGNINTSGSLMTGGTARITNTGVLQNVTASTSILTSGTLGVARGGTGAASFTANGVIYGSGASALGVTAAGTTGDCLVATTGGAPSWQNCATAGSGGSPGGPAGGDLSGTYPNPTVARIQGTALNISTPTSGQILIWNGSGWTNTTVTGDITISSTGVAAITAGSIVNGDLAVGTFGNITGTGALNAGSITSGFGAINNGSSGITSTGTITGATINATSALQTGGTTRISSAGVLNNITGINMTSGNFVQSGSGTFATGTGANTLNGATSITSTLAVTGALTGSSTIQGTRLISTQATGTAPLTVASTTVVSNLNADLLDGLHASAFALASGSGNYIQNGVSVQASANFNISGSGTIGTNLSVAGTSTLTGNVGIGMAPSSYKLDVAGDVHTSGNIYLNPTKAVYFDANNFIGHGPSVAEIHITSGGNTYVNIDSNNNTTNAAFIIGKDRTSTTSGTELFRVNEDATISGSGTLQLSGTGSSSYIMSALGLGTSTPQVGSALTIANGSWISGVDAAGTGYVNMFQVNASNEIQVGAALNIDGGIVLPTDGGQLTFSDLPISGAAASGAPQSYTLRVGSSNVLTVYGEADGAGNAQNLRVAIGSSINPAYTLDVGGDINTTGNYRVNGTVVVNSSGILQVSAASGSYTGITGTGALNAGTITSGFGTIDTGDNITGAVVQGTRFVSTQATGTAPLTVASTTVVSNLNADLLDGQHASAFAAASGSSSYIQNGTSPQTANFNITGNGVIGGTLTVGGDITTGGKLIEKTVTFTPTTVGWYRIVTGAGGSMGGILRAEGAYDNKFTDIEFQYNIGGYGTDGSIQQTRFSSYNGGVISQARISSNGGASLYLDIYVSSATTPGPITLYGYGPRATAFVPSPVVGATSGGTNERVLVLAHGFRTTNGASFAETSGNVGIGVVSASQKLDVQGGNINTSGNLMTGGVLRVSSTGAATFTTINASGVITGNGSGLTALNATQLTTGTVPSARISGSYTGITGTGALNAGSITSGFGSINNGSSGITSTGTITGATINATSALQTGGTTRISSSGNLVSIGTYSGSGNITTTGGVLTVQGTGTNALSGSLTVAGNTTLSGNLTVSGNQFTLDASTLNSALALPNFAANAPIGTAAATVDIKTAFAIAQTTSGRVLSLPSPTTTTAGRVVYVLNTGTASFTMHGVSIPSGYGQIYIWNGATWILGASGGGSAITLQSAYDGGNTVTTSDSKDLAFTLANTTTDSNFVIDIATGSTGAFRVQNNGSDVANIGAAGQLALSVQGATGGLLLGGDVHLYRSAANVLHTPDALSVGGTLNVTGVITGNGSGLTALNATQLTTGTVPIARISGSYTGITGTGALNAGTITSGFGTINTGDTISGSRLISTQATGTAPLTVASTTVVSNLNADMLDGLHASSFAASSGSASYINNTTSPQSANFNITGSGTVGGTLTVASTTRLLNGDNSVGGTNKVQIAFGYSGSTNYSSYIVTRHNGGSAADNAIDFYTGNGTSAGVFPTHAVHGLSINNGQVGIGTTGPGQKLDVQGGNINTSGNLMTGGTTRITNTGVLQNVTADAAILTTGTLASARLSGSYTGITGTGALNAGSITSGFGAIDNGNSGITSTGTITGATINATSALQTGGTQRISSTGVLNNITGINMTSGNFVQSGTGTFATGTGANTLNGATSITSTLAVTGAITGSSTIQGTRLISTVATGTAPLTVASTTLVTNLNADLLDGISSTSLFNNMGQNHATQSDFNAITDFGARFVQGNTNGPGTGSAQYYGLSLGLGADYAFSQYALQLAIPRTTGSDKYLSIRGREGGVWQSWTKISAGYADVAPSGTLTGTTLASNVLTSSLTSVSVLNSGAINTGFGVINTGDTISGSRLIATQTTGTAPLTISSTTVVSNLNADLLDGQHASAFAASSGSSSYINNTTSPQSANFNITGNGVIGGTLTVGGDITTGGNVNSGNSRTANYSSLTGASGDWFPLFTLSDSNGTVMVNLKTYAHSSVTFTVGQGYGPSNAARINILNATISTNGGYANVTGVRILQSGAVEVRLTWSSGPSVSISAQIVGTASTPVPSASLATSVSASPVTDSVTSLSNGLIRGGGNLEIQGNLNVAGVLTGNGSGLNSLNATQLTTGTVPSARISGSYTGITGTGALNAGSITSGFGAINNGSSGITTTGTGSFGNLTVSGVYTANATSTRDKLRVWNSGSYTIGMQSSVTFGYLNDYAMTFQMNNAANRGWWWGADTHSAAQGAMSLTTDGRLYVGNLIDTPSIYTGGTSRLTSAGVLQNITGITAAGVVNINTSGSSATTIGNASSATTVAGTLTVNTYAAASSTVVCRNGNIISTCSTAPPTGSGTAGYLARWTGSNTLGSSVLQDDGSNIGIGTAPTAKLHVTLAQLSSTSGMGAEALAVLRVVGAKGQDTTGTSGVGGGKGSSIFLQAGNGGDAPAGGAWNGQGGSITLQVGSSGSGAGAFGYHGTLFMNPNGFGNVVVNNTSLGSIFHAIEVYGTTALRAKSGDGEVLKVMRANATDFLIANTSTNILHVNGAASITGNATVSGNTYTTTYLFGNNKLALQTNDSWLRLNQNADFASGTFTPGNFWANGTITAGNNLSVTGSIIATSQASVNDGNAANPGYTFNGSPNTGIYTNSGGLGLSASGTQRILIGSGGDVQVWLGSSRAQRICGNHGSGSVSNTYSILGDCTSGGSDFAEYYGSDGNVPAGTIVEYDTSKPIQTFADPNYPDRQANRAYVKSATSRSKTLGIHSTNPYDEILGEDYYNRAVDNIIPIGMAGRVPVRVNASNGPIEVGDPVMLSATPGVGAKATTAGQIIGYSMSTFNGTGEGQVVVLISSTYWAPEVSDILQANQANFGGLQVTGTAYIANLNVSGATTLTTLTVTDAAIFESDLEVRGLLRVADIEVGGHIISRGNAPQIVVGQALGQASITVVNSAPQALVDGTDTTGTITVTAGAAQLTSGVLAEINFNQPFATGISYKAVLTPTNEQATNLRVYIVKTATGFNIVSRDVPVAGTQYQFDYIVLGAQVAQLPSGQ